MSDDMPPIDPDSIRQMISEGRARQLDRAVDQIEELTAERDRLRMAYEGLLQLLDVRKAERDRLRAAVDGLTETVTRDLHVLLRISTVVGERELAPDEAAVGVNFDELPEQVQALVAERDRLRAVVEAAHGVLTGLDWSTGGGKKLVPVTALHALRDALDGSGVMGGPGPAGGAPTREGGGRLDEESGAVHLQAADAPGKMFPAPPADAIAERDRLRALIKEARDARDPTIAVGLPPEEIGRGVRSYLEAVDRLLAEGVTDDEHFAFLYERGESDFAERDRLREQVQGGRRLRFKLAGRNTRLRGVIEDAVAVFGAEEMDYDAWTETLGRMRRSLDVDDVLNFGVEGGEVAGPTSPEYDAVVNQLMDVADERDRLRAGLDTILNGLVGLDSDDAYVAITMEHMNVVRAMLRKDRT